MHIRVLLAFSNMLFSTGIEKILESDPSIKIVRILRPKEVLNSLRDKPDIILADLISLYNYIDKSCLASPGKLILLDTECGKVNIAAAIANKGVGMVLPQHSMPEDLLRAIKRVANEGRTDKGFHLQNTDLADGQDPV
ncbi:MAG: response regulator transcription factor [Deltaproteobacteria bacterium]|nr:response regulator transcription factor [Deltaproteobacteria bacterium]